MWVWLPSLDGGGTFGMGRWPLCLFCSSAGWNGKRVNGTRNEAEGSRFACECPGWWRCALVTPCSMNAYFKEQLPQNEMADFSITPCPIILTCRPVRMVADRASGPQTAETSPPKSLLLRNSPQQWSYCVKEGRRQHNLFLPLLGPCFQKDCGLALRLTSEPSQTRTLL